MTTGLVTEHQGRMVSITKNDVKLVSEDFELDPSVVWFTNIIRSGMDGVHFIGDKPFGKPMKSVENYRVMIKALEQQFVKAYDVTNKNNLFHHIKTKIGSEARTLFVPPEHIKSKLITNMDCPVPMSSSVQKIDVPCSLMSYRIPSSFGNFKSTNHKAGKKIGVYFCTLVNPKGSAGKIMAAGDYWLTHIQVQVLSRYYDVVVKDSYTYHQPGQKDISLKDHPSFEKVFGRGYAGHKIAQYLVEEYLFSMPGIKQGTLNPISVMLRTQRWLKSFKSAVEMADSGLEIYKVDYNKIIAES